MGARQLAWLGLVSALGSGCLLDDDRCGENQTEINELFEGCVCDENAAPNANGVGCHLCGANEEAKGGACVCSAGYSRPNSMAACTMTVDTGIPPDAGTGDAGSGGASTGQGMSCTTSADCEGFDATYCITLQPPSTCIVEGCATGARRCDSAHDCCDFKAFPPLASTNGLCVPTGSCPANIGMVVMP